MSYSSKYVWTAGESVTASKLNAHISDVLNRLYAYHEDVATLVPATSWSTSSTTAVDWNGSTPLQLDFKKIDTNTNIIAVWFVGGYATATSQAKFGVRISGTDYGLTLPMRFVTELNSYQYHGGGVKITGITPATYTIKLRIMMDSGTYTVDEFGYATLHLFEVNP
jgi:hypothetical protein